MDKAQFTKEIAQVLRELEDNESNNNNNNTDDNNAIIYQTYQKFCYDDPIGINSNDCYVLYYALLNSTQNASYALSTRLINGIHQYYTKYQQRQHTSNIPIIEQDQQQQQQYESLLRSDLVNNNDNDNISSSNNTMSGSTSSSNHETLDCSISILLYGIHIQIPLLCCLSKTTLQQACTLLGSFIQKQNNNNNNVATATTHTSQQLQEVLNTIPVNEPMINQQLNGNHNNIPNGEGDNLEDNNNDDNDEIDHATNNGVVINGQHQVTTTTTTTTTTAGNNNETNSLQEIFANESDDSDYEFLSDWNPIITTTSQQDNEEEDGGMNHHEWITTITNMYDPIYLSKYDGSITTITWDDIAFTIIQLIEMIVSSSSSYHNVLLSIIPIQWKRMKLSDPLQQLCIALLVPSSSLHSDIFKSNIHTDYNDNSNGIDDNESTNHWQTLGVRLINVYRDIVIHHITTIINTSSNNNKTIDVTNNDAIVTLLEDYLRLIRILLQVDQQTNNNAIISNNNNHTMPTTNKILPARLVGISSLSSLCGSILIQSKQSSSSSSSSSSLMIQNHPCRSNNTTTIYYQKIIRIVQCNILDLCDELTDILESCLLKSMEDIITIQWTYLSFFQFLSFTTTTTTSTTVTNIVSTTTDTQSTLNSMQNDDAQCLLNSGLFRQWLLVWSKQITDVSCRMLVQDCILDLCIISPTLLGKYAWRFPGLSDEVLSSTTTSTGMDQSYVIRIVWNLLGSHYAALSSSTITNTVRSVQWKTKGESKDGGLTIPKTTLTYQQEAWKVFQSLCSDTLRIVTDWKLRREHNIDRNSTNALTKDQLQLIVNDWDRLAYLFNTNLFLRNLFLETIRKQQSGSNNNQVVETMNTVPTKNIVSGIIRTEVDPIYNLTLNWPIHSNEETNKTNTTTLNGNSDNANSKSDIVNSKSHDSDDDDDKNRNDIIDKDEIIDKAKRKSQYDIEMEMKSINSLRKAIKTIRSIFEVEDDKVALLNVANSNKMD